MRRPIGFELIMLRQANVFGLGHFWSGSSGGPQDAGPAGGRPQRWNGEHSTLRDHCKRICLCQRHGPRRRPCRNRADAGAEHFQHRQRRRNVVQEVLSAVTGAVPGRNPTRSNRARRPKRRSCHSTYPPPSATLAGSRSTRSRPPLRTISMEMKAAQTR